MIVAPSAAFVGSTISTMQRHGAHRSSSMTATSTSRPERRRRWVISPSYNITSDLTKKTTLLGTDATHLHRRLLQCGAVLQLHVQCCPGGNATLGAVSAYQAGLQENWGARVREEVKFNEYWTGLVGFAVERGDIRGLNTTFQL